jgi:hypothetical protein
MMKPVTILKNLTFIFAAVYSLNALAYGDDKKKEICRQPKVQEFTLPEYSDANKVEAQPESEFTFVVSGWADSKKFKLTGKGKDIPFTVQSTETFHKLKAKLPPEFTGQTIRINARIPALLGCYSTIGWLVKVADNPTAGEEKKPTETVSPQDTKKEGATVQDGDVMPPPKPDKTPQPESAAPTNEAPATSPEPSKNAVVAP